MRTIVLLIGLIVIGGVIYFFTTGNSQNDSSHPDGNASNAEVMEEKDSDFSGSLADLQRRGGEYRCTFTHSNDVTQSSGTVYVADDRIRGDFESETQGISVDSYMIVRDGFIYAWSPISPNGFKIPQSDDATEGSDTNTGSEGSYADFEQQYSYNCTRWSVDELMFELPTIDFVSIGSP